MADGNSYLSGIVRSIGRRRGTDAFCFIKNTDCRAPDSHNAFIFLPDAFAHRTIFSSEDWSQLTINQDVGYRADVVKRSRTGCLKLHVTSAWIMRKNRRKNRAQEEYEQEEYEQEEEQSSGVFANEAARPPWRQHPFIIPAEEGMEQEKKKEEQQDEEEAEEEERDKEEEEEEGEEEEPVMVSRRRRFIIPFEEETKEQWNSKKRFRLAQAPIGIRRISPHWRFPCQCMPMACDD